MRNVRYGVVVLWLLVCSVGTASAQVSIGIGLPTLQIGINIPIFPELVPVPGYPVYYAPRVAANYFFYDGMYWIFLDGSWYASYWYNGPWWLVEPDVVPLFILRIPVRYYHHPPSFFRGWRRDAAPRWGEHWGRNWEIRHRGWDRWRRGTAPARAPLPNYQRRYSGDRYPGADQQLRLRQEHYRYRPRDRRVRQHFIQRGERPAPGPVYRGGPEQPRVRTRPPEGVGRPAPIRPAPYERGPAIREPGRMERQRPAARPQGERRFQERGRSQEPVRGREPGRERGRDRND